MAGHDWEQLHEVLGRATGAWSREELVGLLRDLIREYVIERGLPTGSPQQAATPDLSGFDFPQLIVWLKGNLDLPELGLFQVDGRRVIVDADGPRALVASATTNPANSGSPRQAAPGIPTPPATPPIRSAPATQPARPVPAVDEAPAKAAKPKTQKSLSRGFRGLEFD